MRKALLALPILGLAMTVALPASAQTAEPAAPAAAQQAASAPAAPAAPVRVPIMPSAEIAADPANRLTLELSNGGRVVIVMRPDAAPGHVERIRSLAQSGFYNGLMFHRVIPGFMAQGGDPQGTGQGGSQLPDLKAEFNSIPHLRGSVAMARAEAEDSANSQFYIMFAPRASLNGKYTVFGRVIEGMAAVDSIAQGEPPAAPTRIVRATIGNAPIAAISPLGALPPAEVPAPEPAPATE